MPLPHVTSVSRQIIIVCCELVGNCQTLFKDWPLQLVNGIIFRPFFLFFASDVHRFLPLLSCSDVRPPRVLHIVFMFINRQLFISVIFSHVTVFSVFFVKVKLNLWPSVRILITYILINCEWFKIKLCGIGIILLTDLLCGITFNKIFNRFTMYFDCIFKLTENPVVLTKLSKEVKNHCTQLHSDCLAHSNYTTSQWLSCTLRIIFGELPVTKGGCSKGLWYMHVHTFVSSNLYTFCVACKA